MSKVIRFRLDPRSIQGAIREIEAYKRKLSKINDDICLNLAKIGMQEASVRFASAQYDGTNDSVVTIEQIENGYKVIASGKTVAFIEFGTGVHYNSGVSYPLEKPSGIVGIGEYGKKQGKKDEWRYNGEPGTNGELRTSSRTGETYVVTHGNPAQMPMYYALAKMQGEVERIVKEAFRSA